MVNSGLVGILKILMYVAMFFMICMFFTGHGEFIYEGF